MSGNSVAYVWKYEIKTIFAYETFQEIVYHLFCVLKNEKYIRIDTKQTVGILEANDGIIWFGSSFGVHRFDGKTFTDFKSKEGH